MACEGGRNSDYTEITVTAALCYHCISVGEPKMIMKKLLLIFSLLVVSPVHSAFLTGNDLLASCESLMDIAEWSCIGYIKGVSDMTKISQEVLGSQKVICSPEGVTGDQLQKVIVKWLRENPESLHENAASLIWVVQKEAFPCPAK